MSLFALFSPLGCLDKRPFAIAVIVIYVLAAALLLLLTISPLPSGAWVFMSALAALLWLWFSLHAKRLRDAGYSIRMAIGFAVVNCLAVIMFVLVVGIFRLPPTMLLAGYRLYLTVLTIFTVGLEILLDVEPAEAKQFVAEVSGFILYAPLIVSLLMALGHSIWAGTRPSIAERV